MPRKTLASLRPAQLSADQQIREAAVFIATHSMTSSSWTDYQRVLEDRTAKVEHYIRTGAWPKSRF